MTQNHKVDMRQLERIAEGAAVAAQS
jgi:hypothetical protein